MMKYLVSIIIAVALCQSNIAQKRVIIEKFTNSHCGVCPGATIDIKNMVAENPDLFWISHYKPNTWYENPLNNAESVLLYDTLNVPGVPMAMINRTSVNNKPYSGASNWETLIEQEIEKPHFVNLSIENVSINQQSRELKFSVNANFETLPPDNDYKITAIIAEDWVYGVKQSSYFNDVEGHPLEGLGDEIWSYGHRHVVRTILDDIWGTDNSIPNEIELNTDYIQEYSYSVPEDYRLEFIEIICMVSKNGSTNSDIQVLNAAEIKLSELNILSSNEENIEPLTFDITPNPASTFIEIKLDEGVSSLSLIDVTGQIIKTITDPNTLYKMDISNFQSGIYYLQINDGIHTKTEALYITK